MKGDRTPHASTHIQTATDQSDTTVMSLRQLSMLSYATLLLAGIGIIFALPSLLSLPYMQRMVSLDRLINHATDQSCNIRATSPHSSGQAIDAQVVLPDCAAENPWRRVAFQTLPGHLGSVGAVALTPDGNLLASGTGNVIELWDLRAQDQVRVLTCIIHE